jgi:hypothetical protein
MATNNLGGDGYSDDPRQARQIFTTVHYAARKNTPKKGHRTAPIYGNLGQLSVIMGHVMGGGTCSRERGFGPRCGAIVNR